MPRCLLWKRLPGCTIPMVPMQLLPMAPMNRVEQIRALPIQTRTGAGNVTEGPRPGGPGSAPSDCSASAAAWPSGGGVSKRWCSSQRAH
jgi:hypothetical protein